MLDRPTTEVFAKTAWIYGRVSTKEQAERNGDRRAQPPSPT